MGFWLWSDYRIERRTQRDVLVARGRAVLTALGGAIRSHGRMGMWFQESIDTVLQETVDESIVVGLAIMDDNGDRLAVGGRFPADIRPLPEPRLREEGLIVMRRVDFLPLPAERMLMREVRRGPRWLRPEERPALEDTLASGALRGAFRGGRGPMFGPPPGVRPGPAVERMLRGPVWVAAVVNAEAYHAAVARARRRLAASAAIMLSALALGLYVVLLIQRQGRMSNELALARERERRLEELTRLGAGLAHETKNPLSVIRGLAQGLLAANAEQARPARQIIDEADRVVGRINTFLQYSRPAEPRLHAVALDALARQVTDLFADEASARGAALAVEAEPLATLADAAMVRQVLVNLLANALAATGAGGRVTVQTTDAGGESRLSVSDTGEGIAAEDLALVTQPYFTRREGGTGLGLSIVEQIVRAHGWRLRIDSAPGKGTMVVIEGIRALREAAAAERPYS